MKWFQAGIKSGETIVAGRHRLTPRALVVQIRWPGGSGAFTFNRPIAVAVQSGGAPERVLPVVNYTRLAQVGIFALALVLIQIIGSVNHD